MSRAALLLILALAACSSHQYFFPREAVVVESPSGYAAAQYALGEGSDQVGRINVWSRGARYDDREDGTWTVIHVGLEISNTSDMHLEVPVDEVALTSIVGEGLTMEVLDRSTHTGRPDVPPQQVGRIEFEFDVGQGVDPTSLTSFAASWVVNNERDGRYRNLTLFQAGGDYGSGYWGYPAWYWGWGYPWGYPWGYGWYW